MEDDAAAPRRLPACVPACRARRRSPEGGAVRGPPPWGGAAGLARPVPGEGRAAAGKARTAAGQGGKIMKHLLDIRSHRGEGSGTSTCRRSATFRLHAIALAAAAACTL